MFWLDKNTYPSIHSINIFHHWVQSHHPKPIRFDKTCYFLSTKIEVRTRMKGRHYTIPIMGVYVRKKHIPKLMWFFRSFVWKKPYRHVSFFPTSSNEDFDSTAIESALLYHKHFLASVRRTTLPCQNTN